MRFKIDENLPVEAATLFIARGHDAVTVIAQTLSGSADSDIAQVCIQEERILVTLDLDFANIRAYPPQHFPGFVVFRVGRQSKPYLLNLLQNVLPYIDQKEWKHQLWIIEETRIRIREGN